MKIALFRTCIYFSLAAAITTTFTSCVSGGSKKSGLELQAFQKKDFECEKKVAFASTISVFQDLGYIIKSADLETGLISASSPTKNLHFYGSYMSNTEASAFIEELVPKKSSIRLNFVKVNESSSGYGMKSKYDSPIETADAYENAFGKIREAIFIRTNSR